MYDCIIHSFILILFIVIMFGEIHINPVYQKKVLQNKAVTGSKPRTNTTLLYRNHGFLNLHGINSCLIGKFMCNVYHGNVPHIFEGFFTQNLEIHDYNTRIASHLHVPSCSKNLNQTGIRFHGAMVWNKIIKAGLNLDCSEASFKQMLKKYVLQNIIN